MGEVHRQGHPSGRCHHTGEPWTGRRMWERHLVQPGEIKSRIFELELSQRMRSRQSDKMKEEERPGSVGMVSVARSLREGNLLKITGA